MTGEQIDRVVTEAVQQMKDGEFGMTGIKVELEAQLARSSARYRPPCTHIERAICSNCGGDRTLGCTRCNGSGRVLDSWDDEEDCENCDGEGSQYCSECPPRQDCTECPVAPHQWDSVRYCHDWLLERLVPLGLAEPSSSGYRANGNNLADHFKPTGALKFSMFYYDGSVDSEWTFTLDMATPSMVLVLPQVVGLFKEMAELIKDCGGQFDVRGAGMHTALLQTEDCHYPDENRSYGHEFQNFRRSMGMLLPALFFLGATCEESRGLNFRRPMVGDSSEKYSAITYRYGALEYRVFDTCYENPDQILDNIVVMANCMKYWAQNYVDPRLDKKSLLFGNDNDRTLKRFYTTIDHIDVLNAGLQRLKPPYRTMRELKKQRKFTVTRGTLNGQVNKLKRQIANEYKEYEDRFNWRLKIMESDYMSNYLKEWTSKVTRGEATEEEALSTAKEKVKKAMNDQKKKLQTIDQYVNDRVKKTQHEQRGRYTLSC